MCQSEARILHITPFSYSTGVRCRDSEALDTVAVVLVDYLLADAGGFSGSQWTVVALLSDVYVLDPLCLVTKLC